MSVDLLPDCRARSEADERPGRFGPEVAIYCANCGVHYGWFTKSAITFAFALCQKCFDKYGSIAGFMAAPDEVFWDAVRQESEALHGRMLDPVELYFETKAGTSPLAKLVKEGITQGLIIGAPGL